MAPTITTNTETLLPNQEVSFGSIAGGPFDFIDTFVDASANPDADSVIAEWRLYATAGGQQSLVARAPGGGSRASVLNWDVGSASADQQAPFSPARAAGTSYELRAFLSQPSPTGGPNPTVTASIIGYDQFDVAADADAGSVQTIPASGAEVVFATLGGYAQSADVSVRQNFSVPIRFTLYAQAGGGVLAEVRTLVVDQKDGTTRIYSPIRLPGATSYILKGSLASDAPLVAVPNVFASLATQSNSVATGGVVNLVGNANGPSNANTVQSFNESVTNANGNIGTSAHPTGLNYFGFNGLTATRTLTLNPTPTDGDEVQVKDEDGSLAAQNFAVDPGAKTIDLVAGVYTMTAAQNGAFGSISLRYVAAHNNWALV